jgi:glycosyltransferase involved in cell wall biosynthesis
MQAELGNPDRSVIIPAYNEAEAERIAPTQRRINDYLVSSSFSSEILVVLDGPTDNTLDVVRQVSKGISKLRILERQRNRGKGYTVREGILESIGAIAAFLRCGQFYGHRPLRQDAAALRRGL